MRKKEWGKRGRMEEQEEEGEEEGGGNEVRLVGE